MSTEQEEVNDQGIVSPAILAGLTGFMVICAWAFASPNAFKRPTIEVQLSENADSQAEDIITETIDTETTTITTDPESSTTIIETEDTEITATTTEPATGETTDTTTTTEPATGETTDTTTATEPATGETVDAGTTTELATGETVDAGTNTETNTETLEPETPVARTDTTTTSESQEKDLTTAKTLGQIKFGINEVDLSPAAEQTIKNFISEIKEYDPNQVAIRVEGHTSKVGDPQINNEISQDRANAVVKYLREQNIPYQVVGEGKGYSQPVPGSDPTADVNQRTEIILTPAN
ncbi:OmpA family protein [Okeania sp.]|uniref:OmpA family protein n=1 Tax=Okeania sp. TaxID=3100323 RepID=UPI002B4B294D|nr:OmpA family protein [Okeania sp.]MEB3339715.1 OmpA family protein [Okeania sp.]